jgi:hypothetical protein
LSGFDSDSNGPGPGYFKQWVWDFGFGLGSRLSSVSLPDFVSTTVTSYGLFLFRSIDLVDPVMVFGGTWHDAI